MNEEAIQTTETTQTSAPARHPLIDLLLARMESHPEEFLGQGKVGRRWSDIVVAAKLATTSKEDHDLIDNAIKTIQLDSLHKQMMKRLLDGTSYESPEELEQQLKYNAMRQALEARSAYGLANASGLRLANASGMYEPNACGGIFATQEKPVKSLVDKFMDGVRGWI